MMYWYSKKDKNAINECLQEFYEQLEQANKIVKNLIDDCTDSN